MSSLNLKGVCCPTRDRRCQCARCVQLHAPIGAGGPPVRARCRSSTHFALARIRTSEEKSRLSLRSQSSGNAFSTLEHPRHRANLADRPRYLRNKAKKIAIFRLSFWRGVARRAPSNYSYSGVSQPGSPLLNRAFPEAGCHVVAVGSSL
jgi:hypothetical protein